MKAFFREQQQITKPNKNIKQNEIIPALEKVLN